MMMTARQLFHFVTGDQHMQRASFCCLDAFLAIEVYARTRPIACEFREKPIECYDEAGNLIGKKTWEKWHAELMQDTYGHNWQEHIDTATDLAK
jgi:hypothetical protein